MQEPEPPLSDAEWMARFRVRAAEQRIPVFASLELTRLCNLRCLHCYLGSQERQRAARDTEMPTARVLAILDELIAAGTLQLLITGGDPMVRRDFATIYRHAREGGLFVSVFCNGTRVDDEVVALFRELPPLSVEVSLYGATPGTHDGVTGVRGSFRRALRGIRRLQAAGVPVQLKTVLLTPSVHELPALRALAEDLGLPFHTDSAVFPCLTGGRDPLTFRVAPRAAAAAEMADPRVAAEWARQVAQPLPPPTDRLYRCGAGLTSLHVDAEGFASPCLMTTGDRFSLRDRSIASLWAAELAQIRERRAPPGYSCQGCDMIFACSGCPALHFQETGREDAVSDHVCSTARARWTALGRAGRCTPGPE